MSRLKQHFPGLTMDTLSLGTAPTPVRRIDAELGIPGEVWLKDESRYVDGDWGGNKVRKLDWIIPEAKRRGSSTIFTVGGIGTHWGLACAVYGQQHGLKVVLGLIDQPVDDHVREQLSRLERSGATILRFPSATRLKLAAPRIMLQHRPWYLPAGGSNPVGTLGYVEAALEIAEQVRAGELPEPALCVVPVGSGGTTAGLALGFRLAGLGTKVFGAIVNELLPLNSKVLARLANRTAALLHSRGADLNTAKLKPGDLAASAEWLGSTYGDPTPASVDEVRRAATAGLILEPVYTGKSLAACREIASRGNVEGPILWLNTHGPR